MKFLELSPEYGENITAFHSQRVLATAVAHIMDETGIHCFFLKPGGVLGYHPATWNQIFLVVQGEGWVRGPDDDRRIAVKSGQAIYWESGEYHESGTDFGMTVFVIEGNLETGQSVG